MLLPLIFLYLLTPFPSFQASISERKNSTKPAPLTLSPNVPKPVTSLLNVKAKPQNPPTTSKLSNVSQILSSSSKTAVATSVQKTSIDKPSSSSPITVVISDGCLQKESQKDNVNTSKVQGSELSLKPGSPLIMTHRISLESGSCTGSCEVEMTALMERVELLEKEMSTLKKKCILCSDTQCPSNCSGHGKCEAGKCVCHHGFSGPDCSTTLCPSNCNKKGKCVKGKCVCKSGFTGPDCKGVDNKTKVTMETLATKVSSESSTLKQDISSEKKTKADKTIFNKKTDVKEQEKEKKVKSTAKTDVNPTVKNSIVKKQYNDTSKKEVQLGDVLLRPEGGRRQEHARRGKTTVIKIGSENKLKVDINKESKDKLSLNQNVTQSNEKKSKGASKGLETLKGTTDPVSSAVKINLTKGRPFLSNVTSTEKEKKQFQGNITEVIKGGALEKQKLEKHVNVTRSIEKDKKQHGNETLVKDRVSEKKTVDSHVNTTSTEKDKKVLHANVTTVLKTGKKKTESHTNVTITYSKEKKALRDHGTKVLQEVISSNKRVDKHVNVTVPDNKLHQPNVTLFKAESSGKRQVESYHNVTTSSEKVKKLLQGNETAVPKEVTPVRKKIPAIVPVSHDKEKKLFESDQTFKKEDATRKSEKHTNVTLSTEKEKHSPQGNVTHLKDAAFAKPEVNSPLHAITISDEKDKQSVQGTMTTTLEKKVAVKKEVERNVNITTSLNKGKPVLQASETAPLKEKAIKKKLVVSNVTITAEKDKKQLQSNVTAVTKESTKKKVESDVGAKVTETQSLIDRTTKATGIGSLDVHNITATGFIITWEAPQGVFKSFTVTRREVVGESKGDDDAEEAEKSQDSDTKADVEIHSMNRTKFHRKSPKKFSQVLTGSDHSYHFKNLQPQTRHSVSLFGSGPGIRSKVHRLFVSTGPEPPTELQFNNITETSLSVSWKNPKSIVTGFRVTYTNSVKGETGSMSVDSQLSHVLISQLAAGSSYEISVRSFMETIESEPITASITTVPHSPTDLKAVNVTDTKALLTWRPAEAKVDHYILSYGSTKSPNVTVTVMLSGNSVEHQLRGLHRSTLYTVKILSQINNLQSSSISTSFTTTSGVKLQVVTPAEVTFSSAVIAWKVPRLAFRSYRLTYQLGEEVKEVILNPTVTRYELTDLEASSNYTVKVDGESEGQYINVATTSFTTGQLPYPHPADCSQVQLNGVKESGEAEIYPEGKHGEPVWVYCDMETDGGGWTVFQRRVDGSTDFFKSWRDYSKGFGHLSGEFWLGNDILHALTSLAPMSLRIDLRSGNDTAYAYYSNFTVGPEAKHYTIELSGYSGTAGDSMRYHNGRPFSTKDKDPNTLSIHCAKAYMGGWWYKNCYKANLNGLYATFSDNKGIVWIDWKGKDVSLPFTEMKLRPASWSHITPKAQS